MLLTILTILLGWLLVSFVVSCAVAASERHAAASTPATRPGNRFAFLGWPETNISSSLGPVARSDKPYGLGWLPESYSSMQVTSGRGQLVEVWPRPAS